MQQSITPRPEKGADPADLCDVGSSVAGSKSNITPDRVVLLVNLRTYDTDVRQRIIDNIERMVRAECEASGSPHPPEFEYYDQYPLTDEDFSHLPDAFGTPYSFWGIGGIDPEQYERARKASRVEQDIPVNHSEFFAPVIERRGDKAPDKAAPQPPVEIPSAPSTEHVASMRS